MFSQIVQFILNEKIISTVVGVITITSAFKAVYKYLRPSLPGHIVDQLFDALKNGKSIATKAEIKYQIRCYVPPKFICNGSVKTIRQLQQEIKKSGNKIFITGKPASGKTTTMRNLYYRLSRTRKCVYIQMNSIHDLKDFQQRVKEQNFHRRKDNENEPVTVFIDGADEALAFQLPNHKIGIETFCAMYLNGQDSEIYNIFRENDLNLDSIVICLRSEFLEQPEYLKDRNRSQIYTIQKMENRDIVKIYKSLKVLCRLDKSDILSRHQDGRYPSKILEEWRYTRRFQKLLNDAPDSIFRYPMYVRYAYRFMKEYWDQGNLHIENLTSESNLAFSFQILLDAIFKWEFHVYYEQRQNSKAKLKSERAEEAERFNAAIKNCLEHVVEAMPMTPGESNPVISREHLEKILAECAYGEHDHLVIAHCALSADASGQQFSFCHSTFYEYYLAHYLLEKSSYETRKEYLLSPLSSENLKQMYYALLCQKKDQSLRLYNSIGNIKGEKFDLASCLDLQKNKVLEIKDNPQMPIVEILFYLPIVSRFFYHGVVFAREQIEKMMAGEMDLCETKWKSLAPASGLAPCDSVTDLDLGGLPMGSLQGLHAFTNLTCLDLRLDENYRDVANSALAQIRGMSLEQLYIYSDDGELCIRIQEALNRREFFSENIFVETPEFSKAHVQIYRLKCEAEKLRQKSRFYILIRTSLGRSKNEFQKSSEDIDFQTLKAVFELEADESGLLKLQKHELKIDVNENATLWNGLTLAKYYMYLDNIDEDKSAYHIYNRLEPYIEKNSSELSMNFGYAFGKRLFLMDTKRAREWFLFLNKYVSSSESGIREIDVKMNLFKACIRCGDRDLHNLKNEIEKLVVKSPSYIGSSDYCWYLKTHCAQLLTEWKKGKDPDGNLLFTLEKYLNAARIYAKNTKNYIYLSSAIYMKLLYMNRNEEKHQAETLLIDLSKIMPLADQNSDEREKQGQQIRYMEQKLYFLSVSGQKELAIETANNLLEYPYRQNEINKNSVQYIRDHCAGENELYSSMDKHKLWNIIWY